MVASVIEWGSRPFWRLVDKYRLELIETAARERVDGVIFTFVYAKPQDDRFVRKVVRRVEKHGGEVDFVQLRCDRAELFKRLKHPSRAGFRKMKRASTLRDLFRRYDLFSSVPHARNLTIDNTRLSPRQAARSRTSAAERGSGRRAREPDCPEQPSSRQDPAPLQATRSRRDR